MTKSDIIFKAVSYKMQKMSVIFFEIVKTNARTEFGMKNWISVQSSIYVHRTIFRMRNTRIRFFLKFRVWFFSGSGSDPYEITHR